MYDDETNGPIMEQHVLKNNAFAGNKVPKKICIKVTVKVIDLVVI